jgi:NADH-quinone oxidoreductase subunit A
MSWLCFPLTILADVPTEQAVKDAYEISHVLPLTVLCLLGLGVPFFLMAVSWICGRNNPNSAAKEEPYECGLDQTVGTASERFSVKFYIIAMLFLVFDLEVAFLYPFAITYMAIEGWGMFVLLMIFLVMLEVAYLYLYKKGALDWEK